MKNDEKLELKMELFDTISKTKNSLNIPEIKKETEFIFGFCQDLANIKDCSLYQKDILLKANLSNAISSYYLNPDLNFENRLPFIHGLIYASENIAMSDHHFLNLSLEEKNYLLYGQYILKAKEVHMESEYLHYVGLGIATELKMHEANKEGKK